MIKSIFNPLRMFPYNAPPPNNVVAAVEWPREGIA